MARNALKKTAMVGRPEELARTLNEQLCHVVVNGVRRSNVEYAAGKVAAAYLAARRITVVADDDGFVLQTEVHGDILPWLHDVPDGTSIRSITQHGRTQWHVFDEEGACVGLVFHGIGSMWQWRFQPA